MKKLALALVVVLTSGQLMAQELEPSKLEYRNLQLELDNAQLRLKVDSLEETLVEAQAKLIVYSYLEEMMDSLQNVDSNQSMIQEDGSFYVTEERALEIIKDDYEFYNRNYQYRNVKLRRKEANVFWVSLEERHRKYTSLGWDAKVKTLTVNEDGTFNFY